MAEQLKHIQYIIDNYSNQISTVLEQEGISITVDQAMDVFLACDPTPSKKLVDWLVKTYIAQGFLWEDAAAGDRSKVYETLIEFAKYRTRLEGDNRSLSSYKSLGLVWRAVKPFIDQSKQELVLSGKEVRKQEREQVIRESIVLYRSDDLIAAVPLTRNAAEWWGRGTRWCTSATQSENYFDQYNLLSPLIVIVLPNGLNNEGKPCKFQLWANSDQVSFMDEEDISVDRMFISDNWHIFQPFIEWAKEISPFALKWIPNSLIDREELTEILKCNGSVLDVLDDCLKTKELCRIAVAQNPYSISRVPHIYLDSEIFGMALEKSEATFLFRVISAEYQTREICQYVLNKNISAITYIRADLLDEEMILQAIEKAPLSIPQNIPHKFLTQKICWKILEKNVLAFEQLPYHLRSKEMCDWAVNRKGTLIRAVPPEVVDQKMIWNAVKNDPKAIYHIHNNSRMIQYLTAELCEYAVHSMPDSIAFIPDWLITRELAILAVQHNYLNLKYMPDKYKTLELCRIAVENTPEAIDHVPDSIRSKELYMIAWNKDHQNLVCIPRKYIDKEMLWKTIEEFPHLINASQIPDVLITPELCRLAVNKEPTLIFSMPLDLRSSELLNLALDLKPSMLLDDPKFFAKVSNDERLERAEQSVDRKEVNFKPKVEKNIIPVWSERMLDSLKSRLIQSNTREINSTLSFK